MRRPDTPLIFIVEDNKAYSKIVEHNLKINNYENVVIFESGEECLKNLFQKPDIIIQDYVLLGITGLSVLQRTKKLLPQTEFIFLSGKDNVEIAVNTVKYGAYDYIVKNGAAMQRLLQKIDSIVEVRKLRRRNKGLRIYILIFLILTLILAITVYFSLHFRLW